MNIEYIIYGKKGCVYCDAAKKLLTEKKIGFIYKELDTDYDFSDFLLLIADRAPDHKTFPLIFKTIDDENNVEIGAYVGGYTELSKSFEQ